MPRPAVVVRVTATVVGASYACALYLSGVRLEAGMAQVLSYLPAGLTVLVILWDLWLWRLPGVRRISRRPLLAGTWRATLMPTDKSDIPSGGNRGPIVAYIIIAQSYWSVSVRQYTLESRSDSRAAIWSSEGDSSKTLTYTYSNTPKSVHEDRSRAHLGTASLDVVGAEPATLSGFYFTDRYTKGDIAASLVDRGSGYPDFDSAREHCEGA